ncbi:MAG: type IV toxin-antitoxin system AbiEi family antitoxin [Desulfobacterales bacterium]|jgi:hypothetical protein
MQPREKTVIEKALDVFRKRTRIDAKFLYKKTGTNLYGDGIVRLAHENKKWEFKAEVKLRVNRATIAILKQKMERAGEGLLVTDYVNPELAEMMRNEGIFFIDGAGNAFIDAIPLYIFVKGEKQNTVVKAKPVKRLFKAGGLKLIFALLNNPGMEKATYRDMAKAANVALGTVDFVITELNELGYLIDMEKKGRQLLKTKQLLRRWIEAYPENLKPKLVKEKFRTNARYWWKDIQPADFGLFWGGEIAAAELTGYLKPERYTVYTDQLPGKLIYKFKFQKDPNGNIDVLTPFWAFKWNLAEKGLVPPLLIYADLIATGDARAIEAAEIIYDKYLARLIREDR